MRSEYVNALETKARWLRENRPGDAWWREAAVAGEAYLYCLGHGETYFMNKNFCQMVDHARQSIPDDTEFEEHWIQSRCGWLWVDEPFLVPAPAPESDERLKNTDMKALEGLLRIRAVGWRMFPEGTMVYCYQDFEVLNRPGFGMWSYFLLKHGDKMIDRIHQFEGITAKGKGNYEAGRPIELQHEIRWVYAALHLMSQRMTHKSDVPVDRSTRRRAEREGRTVEPSIKVISLRRLEEERAEQATRTVDWQWQWQVRGHWRRQPYADGTYKQIYIDAYVKGPENKPLKDPGAKLFVASR